MPVKYLKWITRDMLRENPNAVFVFGDNCERWGLGGQAKEMRGEPNAVGVATLYATGEFYRNGDPCALSTVSSDLSKVAQALAKGRTVYVPFDGLRDRVKAYAEKNGRSMNTEIVRALEEAFPEPIAAVSVKRLEWHDDDSDRWYCATGIMNYEYEARVTPRGGIRIRFGACGWEDFSGTLEEAFAAAQADYEERIRSALA